MRSYSAAVKTANISEQTQDSNFLKYTSGLINILYTYINLLRENI